MRQRIIATTSTPPALRLLALLVSAAATSACGGTQATQETSVREQEQALDQNLGFEAHAEEPLGWSVHGRQFVSSIDQETVHEGSKSVTFSFERQGSFGALSRALHLPDARGKQIKVSAYLKTEGTIAGWGRLWIEMDRESSPSAYDQIEQRIWGRIDWTKYELTIDVPLDATSIKIGALLAGSGSGWVDDFNVEVLGPAIPASTKTIRIAGIVTGPEGKPVPGALVAVVSATDTTPTAGTETDHEGRFTFEVPEQPYALTATATAFGGVFDPVRKRKAGESNSLVLRKGGRTLSGTITDQSDAPAADQLLVLTRYSEVFGDLFYAKTNAAGQYSVTLPSAAYGMTIEDISHYVPDGHEFDGQADATADLQLHARRPTPHSVIAWIKQHLKPLATAQPGSSLADLRAIKGAIGDARVVGLGEATHGTREFFQLKHRVFEYLVEELGFTVFAIESSFPESLAVNRYIQSGEGDARTALAGMYFWIYNTEEVLELIEWMRKYNADPSHSRKLKFYGIDLQFSPEAAKAVLEYLREVAPDSVASASSAIEPLANYSAAALYKKMNAADKSAIGDYLERLAKRFEDGRADFAARTSPQRWILARQQLRILQQVHRNRIAADRLEGVNIRDAAMAENVQWILDTEPAGTKVALWAHNGHVTRSGESIGFTTLGTHLAKSLGDAYLSVGLVFDRGSFQANDGTRPSNEARGISEIHVGPAPIGDLGRAFSRTKNPLFFLDLRPKNKPDDVEHWFHSKRTMRSVGSHFMTEQYLDRAVIPAVEFDTLLFVEQTTRARPLHSRGWRRE